MRTNSAARLICSWLELGFLPYKATYFMTGHIHLRHIKHRIISVDQSAYSHPSHGYLAISVRCKRKL
jgi:hypothetical protein